MITPRFLFCEFRPAFPWPFLPPERRPAFSADLKSCATSGHPLPWIWVISRRRFELLGQQMLQQRHAICRFKCLGKQAQPNNLWPSGVAHEGIREDTDKTRIPPAATPSLPHRVALRADYSHSDFPGTWKTWFGYYTVATESAMTRK